MKKLEMREVMVVRCDVCGRECNGNYTSFDTDTPHEKHACIHWNEAEQMRCEDKLSADLVAAARSSSGNGSVPTPAPTVSPVPCEHHWTEESKENGWRSNCTRCGLKAQGSGQ